MMIEQVQGIAIQGRCFEDERVLSLFPQENCRMSIVYGKNGSGKSTLAEGFFSIDNENYTGPIKARLVDKNQNTVALSSSEHVFVFDESYIDHNIKIDDDGLGTIVLLGNQINLEDRISNVTAKIEKLGKELETASSEYKKYEEIGGSSNPDTYMEKIREDLKNHWADLDSQIKGNRIRSKVTDDIIQTICTMPVPESLKRLQTEFDSNKKIYDQLSDTDIVSLPVVLPIAYSSESEAALCELLAKKIDHAEPTDREKLIIDTIKNGHQDYVESAKRLFTNPTVQRCPYCYQHLGENYKEELLASIYKVLNSEVDMHKQELEKVQFPAFSQNYDIYRKLDAEATLQIQSKVKNCQSIIQQYQQFIFEKSSNIYTPISIDMLGLYKEIASLNESLASLEKSRQELEASKNKRNQYKKCLLEIVKKISHLRVDAFYQKYTECSLEKSAAEERQQNLNRNIEFFKTELSKLNGEKSDTGIAIKNINLGLDYIFFSEDRLSVVMYEGKYYLQSRGNHVAPKSISVGERNVIALCYFFTEILANQSVEHLYENPQLIVIDDPVSSFDFENRIGIISYLRYQIEQIMLGNPNSKILILSHDLMTVLDLEKSTDEIKATVKGIAKAGSADVYYAQFVDLCLVKLENKYNEYSNLIQKIYDYVLAPTPESSQAIGNIMRRVIEAYANFICKKNVTSVFRDVDILKKLGDRSLYFENFTFRLVLHGESHYEEQCNSFHNDINFFDFISIDEKQRTAKDLLCFLYLINDIHLKAHLQDTKKFKAVSLWCQKIPCDSSIKLTEKQ